MGYHTVYRDVYRESSKYASKGLDPAAGPGYFSPGKTCRSRTASVEREEPKGDPTQGARERNLFKNFNRKQYGIPDTQQTEAFRGKKRKKMRLPFRN